MVDFPIRIVVDPSGAKRGNRDVRRELNRTERAADRLSRTISRAFRIVGGALVLRQIQRFADQYQELENRIRTVTTSQDQLSDSIDRLFQIANRTRQPVGAIVELYQRGSIAAAELGINQQQLLLFTERVGKALAIQGSSAAESRGALIQLSQSLGSGIVRAEEFNSILEGAFPIAQAVARGLDRASGSVARLRQLIVNGEVTSRQFFDAFLKGSQDIESQFDRTQSTISGAFTVLLNNLTRTFGEAAKTSGATGQVTGVLMDLANFVGGSFFKSAMNAVAEAFTRIAQSLRNVIGFLKDPTFQNFMAIGEPIVSGVPRSPDQPPTTSPPPSTVPPPPFSETGSNTLKRQIEAAERYSMQLNTQNELLFQQIRGNTELTREQEIRLQLETRLGDKVLETQPKLVDAIRRQLEEQRQLTEQLERRERLLDDFRTVTQNAFETFIDGARRGKLSFKDLADSIISDMLRIASNRLFDQLFGNGRQQGSLTFGSLFGTGDGLFGGGFASGGIPPAGKVSIVGERGPEFLVGNGRAGVVPGGIGTTVNVINNTGAPVEERRSGTPGVDEVVDIVIGSRKFGKAVDKRVRARTTDGIPR